MWGIALMEVLRQFMWRTEQILWIAIDQSSDDFSCLADLSVARRSNEAKRLREGEGS
jgi:hypothetical protein